MTQNEGYKPREERGWEEFHPDLDIDAEMMIFSANEVDGRYSGGATPRSGPAMLNKAVSESGLNAAVDEALAQQATPNGRDVTLDHLAASVSPIKRRVGRPPKASMLSGLGSPPAPRIVPLPTHNPKEKLNLPKPNFKTVLTFEAFEQDKGVGINYVDKSLANIGYQESDIFVRPEKTYIRGGEGSIEEELDMEFLRRMETDNTSSTALGRVEYDMDEQDERWLDDINRERKAEGVDAIKPAIFEITITQIEKEWHALEKSEFSRAAAYANTH
jgi:NuA3 HAT complex component NTO1